MINHELRFKSLDQQRQTICIFQRFIENLFHNVVI